MKGLFLFSLFTIIYGSLFPFEFKNINWQTEGLPILFSTALFDGGIADILGNIVLFLPLGFAGSELINRHGNHRKYYLFLFGYGFILAIALQIIQLFLPVRVPALYDAIWGILGIILGVILARIIQVRFPEILKSDERLALFALACSWILFLLVPFLFSYDVIEIRKNIMQHMDINQYRLANVILYSCLWISYSELMADTFPNRKNFFLSLEFALVLTTIAKALTYRNIIEPEILLGGLIAIIVMRSGVFKIINLYKIIAILLLFAMFYNSLYPFDFFKYPLKEFAWVPFSELFSDDMLPILRVVLYKVFIYGCILWNLYKAFPNIKYIGYFCIIYAGSIEYFQHLTLQRVGGLTEPFIIIFLMTFIKQHKEKFELYQQDSAEEKTSTP